MAAREKRSAPRLRPSELLLLVLSAGVALTASAPLPLHEKGTLGLADLVPVLALIGAFVLLHLSLELAGSRVDPVVLPLLLALMGISLAANLRLAPALADKQWRWLMLGVLALAATLHLPFNERRLLQRYRYTWAVVGILLVAATLVGGRSIQSGGPRLWLGLGGLSFQPSEVLKLLLVVFLAGYLADKRELLSDATTRLGPLRLPPLPYLAPLAVMLGLSLVLLAAQGDLGAALLLFAISLGMLYLASSRLDYVVAGLALFAVGAYVLHGHIAVVATRVSIWRDPWSQAQDAGFQLIQSLMALAAGGVMGAGLGFGSPTSIPAVHTDFVYAAIVEELGLAGAAAVLALYALLVLRGFRIASLTAEPFERLLAAGLTLALAVQTFIIIGGVVKLIPLTGITLPFLSYGGTSVLTSSVGIGLVLRISAARR